MKYPIIPKILVFSALIAISACSTFNYKTYDEKQYKDIEDPDPNYELTLDRDFQDFTGFMFIGNRIENFSTYFNTYFNANENFNDAYDDYVTRVLASYNERQDSIFARPRLSQEAIDKFNLAIQKASKVIQYHKSSQFMDRSVLLIGKSYFYLGDYLKAERKFSEFISKLKTSRYLDEALLNLAKTQLRLENEKPALERFNDLIKNSDDKVVKSESYQSLAEYYLNKKDYDNAIKNFKSAIEYSNDNEFKAQMQFLVASVTVRSNPRTAAKEFDKVLDYNASFDLEYLARLNTAKYMVLSGDFKNANEIIEDLQVKYKDVPSNLSQVNYLKALYYDEKKDNKASLIQYYDVIQSFPSTISSSDASYKIGKYYEGKNDYLRALKYFRFSTEQSNSGSYNKEALQKANIYKRYFELRSVITGATINTDYDTEFKKKTNKDFNKDGDPNKLPPKNGDNGKNGGEPGFGFLDSIINSDSNVTVQADTSHIIDSSHIKEKQLSEAKFELAELFLYDLNRTDSCEYYLKDALAESYDYDFSAKVLFALSALYRKLDDNVKSEEILNMIVRDYPRSAVANSSRRLLNLSIIDEYTGDSGDSLYSAAENSFISKNYTSALNDFKSLITNYPSSVHIDKAYFGAGWIYENVINNNDSAYLYYSSLIKAIPNSEAAAMVMQKVEEYENFNKTNVKDTTGINNKAPENNNTDPKINTDPKNGTDPKQNDEGNIDPLLLQKELEKSNQENQNPENNNNKDVKGEEDIKKTEEQPPIEQPPVENPNK
ncbi:MAG: tetratricopeptide repeat protein [Ignavibacteria bacterium]